MVMLAVPSFQEVLCVPKDSIYITTGTQFTETTKRLRTIGCRLRKRMDSIYQNFLCHDGQAVECTALIYIRFRMGITYGDWIWQNRRDELFWMSGEIDEMVKGFVDRYVALANASIRDNREMLRYYEEALFILNYVYRKSYGRQEEYRLYETSL